MMPVVLAQPESLDQPRRETSGRDRGSGAESLASPQPDRLVCRPGRPTREKPQFGDDKGTALHGKPVRRSPRLEGDLDPALRDRDGHETVAQRAGGLRIDAPPAARSSL